MEEELHELRDSGEHIVPVDNYNGKKYMLPYNSYHIIIPSGEFIIKENNIYSPRLDIVLTYHKNYINLYIFDPFYENFIDYVKLFINKVHNKRRKINIEINLNSELFSYILVDLECISIKRVVDGYIIAEQISKQICNLPYDSYTRNNVICKYMKDSITLTSNKEEYINTYINYIKSEYMLNNINIKLINNPRIYYNVFNKLNELLSESYKTTLNPHGYLEADYGKYIIKMDNNVLMCNYKKEEIILTGSNVQKFINSITIDNKKDENIYYYYIKKDRWDYPVPRQPTSFDNTHMTIEMTEMLNDVDKFIEDKMEPFRRGYLLYGMQGSGKTLMTDIIAKKYKKDIYRLILGSNEMDNAILIKLIGNVPFRSLAI